MQYMGAFKTTDKIAANTAIVSCTFEMQRFLCQGAIEYAALRFYYTLCFIIFFLPVMCG